MFSYNSLYLHFLTTNPVLTAAMALLGRDFPYFIDRIRPDQLSGRRPSYVIACYI